MSSPAMAKGLPSQMLAPSGLALVISSLELFGYTIMVPACLWMICVRGLKLNIFNLSLLC